MNTHNKHILAAILVILASLAMALCPLPALAQWETTPQVECGFVGTGTTEATQRGGQWMTARDTLHVLVVFVQFPDDRYDTSYSLWPTFPSLGIYPGPTYLNTFIDSTVSQLSANGNLTHYFREMSMGALKLTGKTRFVVTPHTRQWYRSNGWCRWLINKEVLEILDVTLDFAEFDRWKRYAEYDIRREADGRVDDIFTIYRNVAHDLGGSVIDTMRSMGFEGGESSLGYLFPCGGPLEFYVDGGLRRIASGHPAYSSIYPGMGTTSVIAGAGDGWFGKPPYRVQIHELAHHWMTNGQYYGHSGRGFWAMLNDWGVRQNNLNQSPPNSYERELLGWHAPDSIYQNTTGITLTDYVTTNRSVKIRIPGSNPNEFFRLEYHLKLSQFDNPEVHDPSAKGLYMIHQTGNTNPFSQLKLIPADGRWQWTSNEVAYPSYYPSGLAVYRWSHVDRVHGYDDSRGTLFTWTGPHPAPNVPNPSEIHFYRDRFTNQLVEKTIFLGDGNDAFGFAKNNPVTPWSNPNTQNVAKQKTWVSIEITNENPETGAITFNVYFDSTSALSLAPSKPPLGLDPLWLRPVPGWIYLAWGADHWDANPIEPDVNWSELQRKTGNGPWITVYSGPNKTWSDGSIYYDPNGDTPVLFRVRVRDSQNKWSLWSDTFDTRMSNIHHQEKTAQGQLKSEAPAVFALSQNYPNPFNPSTVIRYSVPSGRDLVRGADRQLPVESHVSLKVYDLLGREVATLVNETKGAGYYETTFDASHLGSGVYFYRMQAGPVNGGESFTQVRKFVVMK